jgi:NAD(P)-dependent dehydrogenase (short-subunit alcohol dehydrogenase family)
MDTNVRGPFMLIQAFAGALPPSAEGFVTNVIYQPVWSLTQHLVSYTASKAVGLDPDHGIGAHPAYSGQCDRPGGCATRSPAARCPVRPASAPVPLGHDTSPTEVARAVIMILGLPAMTGQTTIALDGGYLQRAPVRDLAGPEE